jgi:hypothetical protein
MSRRITDKLTSFTIGQAAKLWADDTRERAELIERKLIEAAFKASGDPNSDDIEFEIDTEFLHERYQGLSAAQRDHLLHKQYAKIDGLHVVHRGSPITAETTVRRTALEAWCERERVELPEFLKPAKQEIEARVRAWLRNHIAAVDGGDEVRQTKEIYRKEAITEFRPLLSKRRFNGIWDRTVPEDWKRGGRPKKNIAPAV